MSFLHLLIHCFLFITATVGILEPNLNVHSINVSEVAETAAISHNTSVDNNKVNTHTTQNPTDDSHNSGFVTHSIVFKFFSLLVGGLIVFTLVYVLIQCCHDNNNISFARVRRNEPPPSVIFMENFQSKSELIKNEQLPKYMYGGSFEYIDVDPVNGNKDRPLMSPLSKMTDKR